jgi:hypothetical protein
MSCCTTGIQRDREVLAVLNQKVVVEPVLEVGGLALEGLGKRGGITPDQTGQAGAAHLGIVLPGRNAPDLSPSPEALVLALVKLLEELRDAVGGLHLVSPVSACAFCPYRDPPETASG